MGQPLGVGCGESLVMVVVDVNGKADLGNE